jgi:NAD(P)-dependent dehydrogenase (short-subunit alcohol dehydrogenase family)
METSMLLENKTAIVTGAAGGLGLAIAECFCRDGAKVVISDVQDDKGTAAAEALTAEGHTAVYQRCDVSQRSEIEALVGKAVDLWGRLDVAVANAGIVTVSDPLELTEEDFDKVMSVNLKGVWMTGQIAARQMLAQSPRGGSIINMSSVNAQLTIPEIAPYTMSKGGVAQWTKALGIRLAQEDIRVNAIGPGSINTEIFASIASNPEKMRAIMSRTPMGRAGEPEEIGKVALFLASDLSSYVTGETVFADGGRMGMNYLAPVRDV